MTHMYFLARAEGRISYGHLGRTSLFNTLYLVFYEEKIKNAKNLNFAAFWKKIITLASESKHDNEFGSGMLWLENEKNLHFTYNLLHVTVLSLIRDWIDNKG